MKSYFLSITRYKFNGIELSLSQLVYATDKKKAYEAIEKAFHDQVEDKKDSTYLINISILDTIIGE